MKKKYTIPEIIYLGNAIEKVLGYTGVQDEYAGHGNYKPCAGTWAS